MKSTYLLIGPRFDKNDPKHAGGIIVLFENLLSYCDKYQVNYIVVDTNKGNYKNKFFALVEILFLIIVKLKKVTNISLHGTANDYIFIAPFILIVTKMLNKHFSLRKFAGNFIEIYENCSNLQKFIIRKTLEESSCNFFETHYLVNYFKSFNSNTYWFPNVRNKPNISVDKIYRKRFVFVGAIKQEKGIDVLCEASNLLSNEYKIDIYGVLYDHYTESYFNNYNIAYKGILHPDHVLDTLLKYDVLVLPSFREGYPGVIIEALSVGLPIIATRLRSITEMVSNKSSYLIDPMNIEQLKEALLFFNDENYTVMVDAAKEEFDTFDSNIQTKKYFKKLEEIKC